MKKQQYVFVSSCHEQGGIHCFSLTDTGLVPVGFTPMDRPMYTIAEGDRLYALLRAPFPDSEHSGVLALRIGADGSLTPLESLCSTKGIVGCHLCRMNDATYVTNYVSGSVFKLPDTLITHSGSSVHPTRQTAAHTHFVTPTPDGRYLLVTDLGMDQILTYDTDLGLVDIAETTAGTGPRHLAFSADGTLCYCVNELSSTVTVYAYADGALTMLSEHAALPGDFTGESTAAAIRRTDRHLFVSNRGHDSITCFEMVDKTLQRCGIFDCGGQSPRDFIIVGDRLICTNEADGSVTLLDISNPAQGKLLQKLTIEKALCATPYTV